MSSKSAHTKILYQNEACTFTLTHKEAISEWLLSVISAEGHKAGPLAFIFCSDEALHAYNVTYLDHDTLTDVITFDYSHGRVPDRKVSGDILISIDRVRDNATRLGIPFDNELHRVMVHGVLHLCGYADKVPAAKRLMTRKEDYYLPLLLL